MFLEAWTENANLYGIGSGGVPSPSLADYVTGGRWPPGRRPTGECRGEGARTRAGWRRHRPRRCRTDGPRRSRSRRPIPRDRGRVDRSSGGRESAESGRQGLTAGTPGTGDDGTIGQGLAHDRGQDETRRRQSSDFSLAAFREIHEENRPWVGTAAVALGDQRATLAASSA